MSPVIEFKMRRRILSFKVKRLILILAVVLVVISGAITGVAIYRNRTSPFNIAVLQVDDTSITMRYFLKRLAMSGDSPMAVFEMIMQEMIINQAAPLEPFNIEISDQDINEFMKSLATGNKETSSEDELSEDELEEWYRQLLNETPLSDNEFRDLMYTKLAGIRMNEYLAERVPTVAEQVHIHMIILGSYPEAEELKGRLDEGADFGQLSQELNTDEHLRSQDGDLGWFPRGVLAPNLEAVAFNLDVNQISEPLAFSEQLYAIVKITEKAVARTIAGESLDMIRSRTLENWFTEELKYHEITMRGLENGYDSETEAWVSWQLEQMGQ